MGKVFKLENCHFATNTLKMVYKQSIDLKLAGKRKTHDRYLHVLKCFFVDTLRSIRGNIVIIQ